MDSKTEVITTYHVCRVANSCYSFRLKNFTNSIICSSRYDSNHNIVFALSGTMIKVLECQGLFVHFFNSPTICWQQIEHPYIGHMATKLQTYQYSILKTSFFTVLIWIGTKNLWFQRSYSNRITSINLVELIIPNQTFSKTAESLTSWSKYSK